MRWRTRRKQDNYEEVNLNEEEMKKKIEKFTKTRKVEGKIDCLQNYENSDNCERK